MAKRMDCKDDRGKGAPSFAISQPDVIANVILKAAGQTKAMGSSKSIAGYRST